MYLRQLWSVSVTRWLPSEKIFTVSFPYVILQSACYNVDLSPLAIRCPDPGVPMNGRRVMRGDNVGAIATFSCNLGYRLIGEASIICGSRGQWSRQKPSCRRIGKNYSVLQLPCPHIVL